MEWDTVFKITTAALTSIGGGAVIIFGLSSWLGKIWANRILENEKHKLALEMENTTRELDVIKETTLRFQNDKILTYRAIVDVVARMLATFDAHQIGFLQASDAQNRFHEFNEQRIKVYGYLAMLAPQPVMDAQDQLMDYLLLIAHGSSSYEWMKVRKLAINLLNEVRKDVGIDKSPIAYNGRL